MPEIDRHADEAAQTSRYRPYRRLLRWTPLLILLLAATVLLALWLSGDMQKIYAWYASQLVLPALGLFCLIVLAVAAIRQRRLSRPVVIQGLVAILALLPAVMLIVPVPYPASIATMRPAAAVRLPANVPLKVLAGGDNLQVNHHVVVPDQRWAYDLAVAPYLTGSASLDDYGCYGVPVVAPAAGTVVDAHDGEPDETPGVSSNNWQAPTGNHVFIRLATGTYLVLAHLKQGSVTVQKGQAVEEGQQIGQCGNSGNTSEPHIHIHHQRQDPTLYPLNVAEGLPLYFRDHDGPPMPTGGVREENGQLVAIGATVRHVGKR